MCAYCLLSIHSNGGDCPEYECVSIECADMEEPECEGSLEKEFVPLMYLVLITSK